MIQIRKSVFETNSSSSHSFSIPTENVYDSEGKTLFTDLLSIRGDNSSFYLYCDDFGWGEDVFTDAKTKLSYLVTHLFSGNGGDIKGVCESTEYKMLLNVLHKYCGIEPEKVVFPLGDLGYIDHQSCGMADDIFESEKRIAAFLFNPNSELVIDNDNH